MNEQMLFKDVYCNQLIFDNIQLSDRYKVLDIGLNSRHEVQLNALVDEYQRNGDSENVAHLKAQNALLPLYRKELRKVLLEYLQWMRAMKKDYTFQKVMETQKDLKDTDGFDWLESTELAIDKRKFLLNRLFVKQPIPQDED